MDQIITQLSTMKCIIWKHIVKNKISHTSMVGEKFNLTSVSLNYK